MSDRAGGPSGERCGDCYFFKPSAKKEYLDSDATKKLHEQVGFTPKPQICGYCYCYPETDLNVAEGHWCGEWCRAAIKDATPIEDGNWSVRARNIFRKEDIFTYGDLANRSMADLFSIKNMGKRTIDEIRRALREKGLSLRR